MINSYPNNFLLIKENETIENALKFMKKNSQKCVIVINSFGQLKGSLSDGDVRNFLIKNNNLKASLSKIYNKKPIYFTTHSFNKKKLI